MMNTYYLGTIIILLVYFVLAHVLCLNTVCFEKLTSI